MFRQPNPRANVVYHLQCCMLRDSRYIFVVQARCARGRVAIHRDEERRSRLPLAAIAERTAAAAVALAAVVDCWFAGSTCACVRACVRACCNLCVRVRARVCACVCMNMRARARVVVTDTIYRCGFVHACGRACVRACVRVCVAVRAGASHVPPLVQPQSQFALGPGQENDV
jgi:hypothetical protein